MADFFEKFVQEAEHEELQRHAYVLGQINILFILVGVLFGIIVLGILMYIVIRHRRLSQEREMIKKIQKMEANWRDVEAVCENRPN